jgi:hypothetical protein
MATLLENLITRREAIGTELAALTSSMAGGKPNAAGPNTVDHVGYRMSLLKELREINETISMIEPVENVTEGYV